jgi:hypothetical protein
MLLAGLLAVAYLLVQPPSADLAAQAFRADLFDAHGFLLWNDYWYSGHYLLGYSVLWPPFGAALGPRLAGAVAAVSAAALFGALARRRYGDRARLGVLWFGAATATMLLAGQLTFALGVALALGSLLAAQRDRWPLAAALAALSACASPVAGLFLALCGAALALAGGSRRGFALTAASLVPIAALALAFPSAGYFPFAATAFLPVPLFCIAALVLVPRGERALRVGVVLYAALCVALFAFHTQVGANASRLGSLFGGPVLALALAGRRPLALAVLAAPLLYWQWVAPVRDLASAWGEPPVKEAYYAPLLTELERRTGGRPSMVEIPPTRDRGEARYVAPRFPIARGWLRQLESDDFDLFTGRHLTARAYERWLDDRGVAYVAVADAEPDYVASDEEALIRGGLPYLRPVWSDEHWRLYAVRGSPGLVSLVGDPEAPAGANGRLTALGAAGFTLRAGERHAFLVRLHHTPYWTVTSGDACVGADGPWTRVEAGRPGRIEISARFSLGGLFRRDRECSG